MKLLVIVVLVAAAGLGIWRYIANRVDYTKPEQVSSAFIAAIKSHNLSKAGKYWVPDAADAWVAAATTRVDQMQSGSSERFFEDLPANGSTFTTVPRSPNDKAPANEVTMVNGTTMVDLRQIDGKWYVCKAPL